MQYIDMNTGVSRDLVHRNGKVYARVLPLLPSLVR